MKTLFAPRLVVSLAASLAVCLALPGCFSPDPGGADSTDGGTDADGSGTDPMPGADSTDGAASTGGATDPMPGGSTTGMPPQGSSDTDDDIDFSEEFDADRGQWTFADDPGAEQEGPGQWEYRAGELVQTSDISGPDGVTPSRGTFAVGGDVDWDAYSVEVAFTADDDGVAGVLCHASGAGDYVRLDLDHETGLVQLVRRSAATFTLLAETAAFTPPVALGVQRVFRLECGAQYRGFVDGELVVEAQGDAAAEGAVGVYASSIGDGPDGLRFHWLEVD